MDSKGTPPSERDGAGERWTQRLQCWHLWCDQPKSVWKGENSKTHPQNFKDRITQVIKKWTKIITKQNYRTKKGRMIKIKWTKDRLTDSHIKKKEKKKNGKGEPQRAREWRLEMRKEWLQQMLENIQLVSSAQQLFTRDIHKTKAHWRYFNLTSNGKLLLSLLKLSGESPRGGC